MNLYNIRDIEATEVEVESRPAYYCDTKTKPLSSSHALPDEDLIVNFDRPLTPQYLGQLADYANALEKYNLSYPCIQYYGRLRFYSLQHTCQELNALSKKALEDRNPTREDLDRLRFLLHEHATAMKDLVYINQDLGEVTKDIDVATRQHIKENQFLHRDGKFYGPRDLKSLSDRLQVRLKRSCLLKWLPESNSKSWAYYTKGVPSEEISLAVRIISSIVLGSTTLASGASIIVPMVIMSLNSSKAKSLVTVSVAVVIFGFVLAVLKLKMESVVVATASYAAVLAVFVGTSGTGG